MTTKPVKLFYMLVAVTVNLIWPERKDESSDEFY